MSEQEQTPIPPQPLAREPVFLLPGAVTALAALMVAIHLASTFFLNNQQYAWLLDTFAFYPYDLIRAESDISFALPLIWTPITHALLHAGWDHILINVAWLVIFATPLTRRYGGGPMLAIFAVSSIAGAAFFGATTLYDGVYLIGASGGVAGLTGAAIRFIFQPVLMSRDPETGKPVVLGRRLASIREVFIQPNSRWFTLIWLLLNAAVPLVPMITGAALNVAWQAHLGGFAAGFLLVGVFERRV